MKTTKIPIYDLLIFLDEKGETFERKSNILDFIMEHYNCLTNITPKFSKEHVIETLCFCDNGLISNGSFPAKEGILVKNKKGEYGITFHGQHKYKSDPNMTSALWIWTLDDKGMLVSDAFNINDWEKWGAITSLYQYYDYEEGINYNLGERNMSRGMVGKDVLLIQQHLSLYDADVPLTGEFEEKTESFIKGIQRMHFNYTDIDGIIKKEHLDIYLR